MQILNVEKQRQSKEMKLQAQHLKSTHKKVQVMQDTLVKKHLYS